MSGNNGSGTSATPSAVSIMSLDEAARRIQISLIARAALVRAANQQRQYAAVKRKKEQQQQQQTQASHVGGNEHHHDTTTTSNGSDAAGKKKTSSSATSKRGSAATAAGAAKQQQHVPARNAKSSATSSKSLRKSALEPLPTTTTTTVFVLGEQGATGAAGRDGASGARGPRGLPGLPGRQGSAGLRGEQGATGIQGQQGLQGRQGATGIQGQQGLQGRQGATGIQGLQGEQGRQGATGIQGLQGLEGRAGATGLPGLHGEQGQQGATGIQGLQGFRGQQGATGMQGLQGVEGRAGATGMPGRDGDMGPRGESVLHQRVVFVDPKYATADSRVECGAAPARSLAHALELLASHLEEAATPHEKLSPVPWVIQFSPGEHTIGDIVFPTNVELILQGTHTGATTLLGSITVPAAVRGGGLSDLTLRNMASVATTTMEAGNHIAAAVLTFRSSEEATDGGLVPPLASEQPCLFNVQRVHFDVVHYHSLNPASVQTIISIGSRSRARVHSRACRYTLNTQASYIPVQQSVCGNTNIDCIVHIAAATSAASFTSNGDDFQLHTHNRYADATTPRIAIIYGGDSGAYYDVSHASIALHIHNCFGPGTITPVNAAVAILHGGRADIHHCHVAWNDATDYTRVPENASNNSFSLLWRGAAAAAAAPPPPGIVQVSSSSGDTTMTTLSYIHTVIRSTVSDSAIRHIVFMCRGGGNNGASILDCSWSGQHPRDDDIRPRIPDDQSSNLKYRVTYGNGTTSTSAGLALGTRSFVATGAQPSYHVSDRDSTILADVATTDHAVITLAPCAAGGSSTISGEGRVVIIRRVDTHPLNRLTLQSWHGDTIEGKTSIQLDVGESIMLHADPAGNVWRCVARHGNDVSTTPFVANGAYTLSYANGTALDCHYVGLGCHAAEFGDVAFVMPVVNEAHLTRLSVQATNKGVNLLFYTGVKQIDVAFDLAVAAFGSTTPVSAGASAPVAVLSFTQENQVRSATVPMSAALQPNQLVALRAHIVRVLYQDVPVPVSLKLTSTNAGARVTETL